MARMREFGQYLCISGWDVPEREIMAAKQVLLQGITKILDQTGGFIVKEITLYPDEDAGDDAQITNVTTIGYRIGLRVEEPNVIADMREPKAGDKLYHHDEPEEELTVEEVGKGRVYCIALDAEPPRGVAFRKTIIGTDLFYEQENAHIMHEFDKTLPGLLREGETPPPIKTL